MAHFGPLISSPSSLHLTLREPPSLSGHLRCPWTGRPAECGERRRPRRPRRPRRAACGAQHVQQGRWGTAGAAQPCGGVLLWCPAWAAKKAVQDGTCYIGFFNVKNGLDPTSERLVPAASPHLRVSAPHGNWANRVAADPHRAGKAFQLGTCPTSMRNQLSMG